MNRGCPEIPLRDVLLPRRERASEADLISGGTLVVSKVSFDDGRIEFRSDIRTKTAMILVEPGDLLVSGINAHRGAIALYDPESERPAAATIHYSAYAVRPDRANARFLWHLLRSRVFQERLAQALPGGIKTELRAPRLLEITVPMPSLHAQQRLADQIDELYERVDEARDARRTSAHETRRLLSVAVDRLFENGRESGWTLKRLEDYIVDARYGTSRKTTVDAVGTPVIRMGNIQDGQLDLGDLKYLPLEHTERQKLTLQSGDILVNRTNSAELVGKCAVFDHEGDYSFASYLIRLRLDLTRADPRLVAYYINSPAGRRYMFEKRKQMTGQANINSRTLRALPIGLPSLDDQRSAVAYLDGLKMKIDEVRHLQRSADEELRALIPSVISRALIRGC